MIQKLRLSAHFNAKNVGVNGLVKLTYEVENFDVLTQQAILRPNKFENSVVDVEHIFSCD